MASQTAIGHHTVQENTSISGHKADEETPTDDQKDKVRSTHTCRSRRLTKYPATAKQYLSIWSYHWRCCYPEYP